MQDELLTIGRFARLCRLSVKQQPGHYDEMGPLAPLRVDTPTPAHLIVPVQAVMA
ncbi:hypothetical protein ACQP1W_48115 [Spirillospora sp. CA-255316]